jgi:hypothetical protein
MLMGMPLDLTPTKRGTVSGAGTSVPCYFVGSIKCS